MNRRTATATAVPSFTHLTVTPADPLPASLTHDHDDVWCTPCDRCNHCRDEHASGFEHEECEIAGCECSKHLAAGDCHGCDATGEVWFDVECRGGRVLDDMLPCPDCGGSGAVGGNSWRWAR